MTGKYNRPRPSYMVQRNDNSSTHYSDLSPQFTPVQILINLKMYALL